MSVQTQQERVLASLRAHPNEGITQVDFEAPNVIDGGKPILRVAARIEELKRERNVGIEVVGRRNRCSIYRLVDVEGGDARSPSSMLAPVAPLSAGQARVCWATRECMAAGPLDGPTCPRGANHKVRTVHYVDPFPAAVEERIAA